MILTTLPQIQLYRLRVLIKALSLEMLGLKRSQPPSAYVILKKEHGFTGNREKVFKQAQEYADELAHTLQQEKEHEELLGPEQQRTTGLGRK